MNNLDYYDDVIDNFFIPSSLLNETSDNIETLENINNYENKIDPELVEIEDMKKGFKSKYWIFTYNMNNINRRILPTIMMDWIIKSGVVDYCIFQLEKGENETEHYQGFISYKNQKHLNSINKYWKNYGVWIAASRNPNAARQYCMKISTRVLKNGIDAGPWEHGTWIIKKELKSKKAEKRRMETAEKIDSGEITKTEQISTDLLIIHGKMRFAEILNLKTPRLQKMLNICITGPPGIGKSHVIHEHCKGEITTFQRCNSGWWCPGHTTEKVLLIDEFNGYMPIMNLLKLTDKWDKYIEGKGVIFKGNYEFCIILSNIQINKWYTETKEGKIINLIEDEQRQALYRRFGYSSWANDPSRLGETIDLYDFFWANMNKMTLRLKLKEKIEEIIKL